MTKAGQPECQRASSDAAPARRVHRRTDRTARTGDVTAPGLRLCRVPGLPPPASASPPASAFPPARRAAPAPVRSSLMSAPVVRIAAAADAPALAALRRAWTAEWYPGDGGAGDEGFEARFLDWYQREAARRVTWLAELSGEPAGMVNLAVFERMPQPGRDPGSWGYLGNAFVLPAYRDQGIGSRLLRALLDYADARGYVRVVLNPSERSVPALPAIRLQRRARPARPAPRGVSSRLASRGQSGGQPGWLARSAVALEVGGRPLLRADRGLERGGVGREPACARRPGRPGARPAGRGSRPSRPRSGPPSSPGAGR